MGDHCVIKYLASPFLSLKEKSLLVQHKKLEKSGYMNERPLFISILIVESVIP